MRKRQSRERRNHSQDDKKSNDFPNADNYFAFEHGGGIILKMAFVKSKIFLILEIALMIVIAVSFLEISKKKKNIESEITALASELDQAETENQALKQLERDISSDSYIELEAKRKLGYSKSGETVVVFYEESPPHGENDNEPRDDDERESFTNPKKWLRYFFP